MSTTYAFVIRANGEFEVTEWPASRTLNFLQTTIDCTYVEAVTITPEFTVWMDEDGRHTGKPVNYAATILHAVNAEPHGFHHGTAVITSGPINGETQGLTSLQIAKLAEFFLFFAGSRIPEQRTK
ncbi:DUF3846 domain-containing protein [Streptomyces sp. JV180]|uniref:DUF3846 domain-containing protein n=1 Tax=Streptomyces sp. JV180 TaxID=858634 RepID=UPI00168AF611|nr:DUF3846 domain-containing protein [Streptomyces sp. JV180]MBD3549978.1 DUF3846 domain-containing protein [Streptomyces sp. JV180]